MNRTEIEEKVVKIVEEYTLDPVDKSDYNSMLGDIEIDSMDVMNIANDISKSFPIEVKESEIDSKNFFSIDTITKYISTKI